jgi:hypothetical protein
LFEKVRGRRHVVGFGTDKGQTFHSVSCEFVRKTDDWLQTHAYKGNRDDTSRGAEESTDSSAAVAVAVADDASRVEKTGALRVRNLGDIRRRTRMSDVIERDDDMVCWVSMASRSTTPRT